MIEEGKIAGAALDVLSKEFSGKADWILNSKILESKELGKKILDNSGLKIIAADDLGDAADKIVKAI